MKPIETILAKLREAGSEPVQAGSGWQSKCPAHDDQQPSLSISEADDGKVLLKCHAGCEPTSIVSQLALAMKDLFPPKARKAGGKLRAFPSLDEAVDSMRRTAGRAAHQDLVEVARYSYKSRMGADVFAIVRFEPEPRDGTKTYRPFHVVDARWRCGDPDGLLPLYRSELDAGAKRVYVVEGEKCADAGSALGLLCTTSAHGAEAAAKTDWTPLAGRDVVILPDQDDPGMKYATDVARILTSLVPPAKARIVKLPDLDNSGDDIVDYIDRHKGKPVDEIRRAIEALADAAPEWVDDAPRAEILDAAPDTISRPICIVAGRGHLTTWVHVRAGGEDVVERVVLREDGAMFADAVVPGALPLAELGVSVRLAHVPHFDSVMSGAALKRYVAGERAEPGDVFQRVRTVVECFMDFAHSVGTQSDLVDLIAIYIIASYLLDAFTVIGYVWPNGDKGVGKTKLLIVVTDMACMGVLVTAGGTFASLRDLADYGATLGFDDSESIMDVRRADPDKRTLLLAGNRRGTYVTLKEPLGDGWTTRYVHAFCQRLFSAINLPDETLASRTIVVPLVRSSDGVKANRDPADHDVWPVDRRRLVDDLWALGLANLTAVRTCDRLVSQRVPLVGRVLEPWRAILAVALWLQESHGVTGIFDRMSALAVHYQDERGDIEDASPVRVLIQALRRMLDAAKATAIEFTPTELATAMNKIATEDDIDHPGDMFTNARKVGRLLQRLRMQRAERTSGAKRWSVTQEGVNALARAYGMDTGSCRVAVPAVDAVMRQTPSRSDAIGTTSEDECRYAVPAVDAVMRETPSAERHTASGPTATTSVSVATAANELNWGAA